MKRFTLVCFVIGCGFSQPKLHTTDGGGADSSPDATAPCPSGGCELLAIEPSIANTGDSIALEGTFAAQATVSFPGGATAQATVLGDHRATVVVPAGASAGDLTVTSGGATLGPVPFRRASFHLGLQTFQTFDEQINGARQMPALVTGRNNQDAMVTAANGSVYVVGGTGAGGVLSSVERAPVNADGSLGAFTTLASTLTIPRQSGATIAIGDFLYVLGGSSTPSIERAQINADGSLGTFAVVSSALPAPRFGFDVTVVGNFLYVLGGDDGASPVLTVLRAPIAADGSLGSFTTATTALLGGHSHGSSLVRGSTLYVVGPDNVEAAPIQPDGTVSAFAVAATLIHTRISAPTYAIGNKIYVVGGFDPAITNLRTDVEAAAINLDGSLAIFAMDPNISLPVAQAGGACEVGGYAYLVGGSDAGQSRSTRVQRGSLNASGGLGTAAAATVSLSVARDRFGEAVIGNNLYIVGGATNGAATTAIDRATIAPDGTLGAFAAVSGTHLVTGRAEAGVAVIGRFLYVIGGLSGTTGPFVTTVERAPINADGSLGAFATVSGVNLVAARNSFQTVVAGSSLYVIGGYDGSTTLGTIERAPINTDGTIGTFATITPVLQTTRNSAASFVSGGFVYVMGGCNVSVCPLASIERASLAADGTLGAFSTVTSTFKSARYSFALVLAGSTVYALGGQEASSLTTGIEAATVDGNGTLASFATLPAALPDPRVYTQGASLANVAYVIGGKNASASLSSVAQGPLQ